jgi:hypothetical protein
VALVACNVAHAKASAFAMICFFYTGEESMRRSEYRKFRNRIEGARGVRQEDKEIKQVRPMAFRLLLMMLWAKIRNGG